MGEWYALFFFTSLSDRIRELIPIISGAAYTASKHGLIRLTKSTASFYGNKGIRCNALMLGGMDTNITDGLKSSINMEGYQKMNALFKAVDAPLCDIDEVAGFCVTTTYGKGAGLINGACIAVDNGWSGVLG